MGSLKHCQGCIFLCFLLAGLVSHNLAATVKDQKNYYSPNPGSRSPHRGSHTPTPRPPTHGTPSNPPSGGYTPRPSNPSTPGNCGTPPRVPTPSTPRYYPPPAPSTPTPVIVTPPTPVTPVTPPTPVTPVTPPTPVTPITPVTPTIPSTPPFVPDPNSPFSCYYWKTHPSIIWGLLGWWGTLGSAFGVTTLPGFGATMSLPQALSNTRNDGYGLLYREGTASLLNSMVSTRFPFTTNQVRDSFVSALASNKAAAAQGKVYKMANEGKLKRRV